MKVSIKIILCFLIGLDTLNATTYYVATTGNNANSGLSVSLPWATLTYAAGNSSPVIAGDTVFVKSGNYGAEFVVFTKSGTSINPIVFQGYKNNPGDAPALLVSNANPYAAFVTTEMPTFNGGNRASGIGFNCQNQNYLVINNFQVRDYGYGLIAGSTTTAGNLTLNNVNVMSTGNINSSYSGEGILLGSMGSKFSNNNKMTNCLVVNSAAEGFGINGDYNTLTNCKVYCNENTANAATDYYIIVTGSYNTFYNCYIERLAGLSHGGHGMGAKTNAEQVVDQQLNVPAIAAQYNKFYFCTAKNMGESFYVRHRTAKYNLFYHCKATGTHTGANNSNSGEGNCMVTRDGASDNIFDGCIAENCSSAFDFVDTVEDGDTGPNPVGHPGNNNKYINCIINNCYAGIEFNSYSIASDAGNNTIANCTFYKTRYLHIAGRDCANMKYINNIYYGCLPSTPGGSFKGGPYASSILPNGTNTYFKNCDFINIEGNLPANFLSSSLNSIALDPLFVNAATQNFHLQNTSPCINAAFTLPSVITDHDSIARPQGPNYDMGAFEFICTSATPTANTIQGFCNAATIANLTATGTAIQWYTGATGGTALSPTVALINNTTYYVSQTVSGCSSATRLAVVANIFNSPTVNITSSSNVICVGQTATLTGSGATTYSWNTNSTTNTIAISPSVTSSYTLTGTSNNCSTTFIFTQSVSICTTINDLKTGTQPFISSMFPNPLAEENLTLTLTENVKVKVYDLLGKCLFTEDLKAGKSIISMKEYANGIYFISVLQGSKNETHKLIKH